MVEVGLDISPLVEFGAPKPDLKLRRLGGTNEVWVPRFAPPTLLRIDVNDTFGFIIYKHRLL